MRFRTTWLLLLFVSAVVSLAQTAPAAKAADVSTDPHCKLIFQNEYTRVYLLKLAKGERARFTVPNSYMRISIDDATLALLTDKTAPREDYKKGAADFFDKDTEQYIENAGNGRYRAVYVEVLKGKLVRRDKDGGPLLGQMPPAAASVDADPMDLGSVTEIGYAIPPTEFTKWHSHPYPYLLVAVSDLDLVTETTGKPNTTTEMKDGEVKWLPAVAAKHRVGNREAKQPEDKAKELERKQEGETEEDNEGAAIFYAIEFK